MAYWTWVLQMLSRAICPFSRRNIWFFCNQDQYLICSSLRSMTVSKSRRSLQSESSKVPPLSFSSLSVSVMSWAQQHCQFCCVKKLFDVRLIQSCFFSVLIAVAKGLILAPCQRKQSLRRDCGSPSFKAACHIAQQSRIKENISHFPSFSQHVRPCYPQLGESVMSFLLS